MSFAPGWKISRWVHVPWYLVALPGYVASVVTCPGQGLLDCPARCWFFAIALSAWTFASQLGRLR